MNEHVIAQLTLLGKLSELDGDNPFKARAYQKAVQTIQTVGADLGTVEFDTLPGIGDGISKKIREIIDTGTCQKLEDLKQKYEGYLGLLSVPGIGPKKAKTFFEQGIKSRDDLLAAVTSGRVTDVRIIEGLKTDTSRIPLEQALKLSEEISYAISLHVMLLKSVFCGSLRRKSPTVGDLDLVVLPYTLEPAKAAIKKVLPELSQEGEKKLSGVYKGKQLDIRFAEPQNFGSMILYFTGSREFNIQMRKIAKAKGLLLNEYGLFKGTKLLHSETEEGIFKALKIKFVEPQDRDAVILVQQGYI